MYIRIIIFRHSYSLHTNVHSGLNFVPWKLKDFNFYPLKRHKKTWFWHHGTVYICAPSAGERRQDDKLCLCVYVQWMSPLCLLFSMTAQTDGVWPLVCCLEDPTMTYSCADVAERRPHTTGIVPTLRMQKEIGRDAHGQTAFVRSVKMFMFLL